MSEHESEAEQLLKRIWNTSWAKQPQRGMNDMTEIFQQAPVPREVRQQVAGLMFDHRYDPERALAALQRRTAE
ncbi:MAG: hypothetical protein AAF358_13585 [Pseudomonadota bacterium]